MAFKLAKPSRVIFAVCLQVVWLGASRTGWAHCDGMDGPVVRAAQEAIRTGNVDLALIWVSERDEAEIVRAFQRTMGVRKLSPEVADLADTAFFETLVRVHRAGEGAAYTGLQPAGRDWGPAIPAADRAVATGSLQPVSELLIHTMQHGLAEHFAAVRDRQGYDPHDVEAGREYVRGYVEFIHYVERLYEAATTTAHGHFPEGSHEAEE